MYVYIESSIYLCMYVCTYAYIYICLYLHECTCVGVCMYNFLCIHGQGRQTSQAYCALPLAFGAFSALVHIVWNLWVRSPYLRALFSTRSAWWVLTLSAYCVAIPRGPAIESLPWQSLLALASTLAQVPHQPFEFRDAFCFGHALITL